MFCEGVRSTPTRGESPMRKLIAQEWMSFDGVVQAPGDPGEDTTGGFKHGGWHLPYFDETSMEWVLQNVNSAAGFVLGRRTYEGFAGHWPNASEEEQPLATPLNAKPKYVASKTLRDPLAWENSTVLGGDGTEAIEALKKGDGGDLLLIGSAQLARSLIEDDLVDEIRVMMDPLLLGGGKRVFPEDGALRQFQLLESRSTATGAILASFGRGTRE
jgi:dihydrofolate reductase